MKISTLALFILLVFQAACTESQIRNIHLEGDLVSKEIITASYDMPSGYNSPEISWFISKSPESEWEKLPGIWTDKIVLLTSYIGKYLKFEISAQPENGGEKISGSSFQQDLWNIKAIPIPTGSMTPDSVSCFII